ncbi:MAG: antitoxin HigA [Sphingomonadales bacterium]|jgi:addiction module HigA family antidote|nr:antitoxin HigA [Sphingomonadales bacterium]
MTNRLLKGLAPTHPGEILREDVLPALGMPKTAIARALHVSRQQLYDILNEKKPVTSQMALRIGKLTRTSPEMWLRMQCAYDLAVLEPRMAEELENIPVLEAA